MPFCRNCGTQYTEGVKFCGNCGSALDAAAQPSTYHVTSTIDGAIVSTYPRKDTGNVALIAGLGGLFLFGLGHFYVGTIGKGVIYLIVGLIVKIPLIWLLPVGMMSVFFGQTEGFAALAGLALINLFLWVLQIYDAYGLAKKYNSEAERTGKAPW